MAAANNIFDDLIGKIGDFLDNRVGGAVEGLGTLAGNIAEAVTGGLFNREEKTNFTPSNERIETIASVTPPKRDVAETTQPPEVLGESIKSQIQGMKPLTTVEIDTKSPEFQVKGTESYAYIDSLSPTTGGPAGQAQGQQQQQTNTGSRGAGGSMFG